MLRFFKGYKVVEKWEVEAQESWEQYVVGMAGNEFNVTIGVGSTGELKVYGDGSMVVTFDTIHDPTSASDMLSSKLTDREQVKWLNQIK